MYSRMVSTLFPLVTFDTLISCNTVMNRVETGIKCVTREIDTRKALLDFMQIKYCGEEKNVVPCQMESAIEELLKRHPNIDRMMAETLLKLHEQGKLEQFQARLDEKPLPLDDVVVQGITD